MNLVALQHAMQFPPAHYTEAPLDTYRQFIAQVEQLHAFAKEVRAFADQVSELRYLDLATRAILASGREHGSVRIDDHGQTVKCEVKRIVEWDQVKLRQLARNIAASGDIPEQYMTISYKVSETNYNSWPAPLRQQFEGARSVRPAKPSFRLEQPHVVLAAQEAWQ
ncbi:hypothetical protein CR47_0211395 [Ralstonia solanacearum]|uniref:hypothetical protein n=1 Tax=Ralstonia solanacearum TaxID=305 RepID=UPI0004DA2CD6|nr:hypothetical protein [Ralstonia solanacearum]ALF90980.1 hypothetical protein RSUY_46780 [Ralstonia solanacearum]ATI30390.1 hypothetical protein CCY86_23545 [Ralstonia solanacearum]KFZ94014.1 hypothetical protein CR47_0211395 [Ralstonia solanacearum]